MTVVALCAMTGSYNVGQNLRAHLAAIDEGRRRGAELIVFPECSLHGYPDHATRTSATGRLPSPPAESVATGPSSQVVIEHARRRRIHVVYGLNEEAEPAGPLYNTAVLTGPDGLIGSYRKVHLGAHETALWTPGDQWPVFETALGRIGLLICGDKAWPESTRELALGGADMMIMPTAWAFVVGGDSSIDARWAEYYLLFDRARAAENARWFISANYVGQLGNTSFGGHSQIVDPTGTVVATSRDRAGLLIADIDVAAGITEAEAAWPGPGLLADRRPSTYRRAGDEFPATSGGETAQC